MSKPSSPDGSTSPEQLSFSKFSALTSPPFLTEEQKHARHFNSFKPFWRLNDPLCAGVLAEGLNPNRFAWQKAIFPLFRDASLFGLPRAKQSLVDWQPFAFFAGREFGRTYPERSSALLDLVADPTALLCQLRDVIGLREVNPWTLHDAYAKLGIGHKGEPEHLERDLIRRVSESFAAGLASATLATCHADLLGFLARIHPRVTEQRTQLHIRALIHSCADAARQPVVKRLQHPLIRIAAEKYPRTPTEKAAILPFFHEQLRAFGVKSENHCPGGDLDLVDWVEAATVYGRRLLEKSPARVKAVTRRAGSEEVESIANVAEDVLRRAKSCRPVDLTRAILNWHETVYHWRQPIYYGQALDRVVNCSDLVIWAAWLGLCK